ncbi:MAG: FG-GAP-like repeat-containing protein [candidate division FCPU426 bacterium]
MIKIRVMFFSLILILPLQSVTMAAELWQADGVAVCTATNTQTGQMILTDDQGGALVLWSDNRSDEWRWSLFSQHLDGNGQALWEADGKAIKDNDNYLSQYSFCRDGQGGTFYVSRQDNSGWSSTGPRTLAVHLDENGQMIWSGTLAATRSKQWIWTIGDGQGGLFMAWVDTRNGDNDIYSQRIDGTGNIQWGTSDRPVCSLTGNQNNPQLVPDGNGGVYISWSDDRNGNTDIYCQRLDATGAPLWTINGVSVCQENHNQQLIKMLSDQQGGVSYIWSDDRNGNMDIYCQRLNAVGQRLWSASGQIICTESHDQTSADAIAAPSGGLAVTWSDIRNGTNDVFIQYIDGNGTQLLEGAGRAVSAGPGEEVTPQLAAGWYGNVIIAWDSDQNGNHDVYYQCLDYNGLNLLPSNGVRLGNEDHDQVRPRIVGDNAGGAIIAWQDSRNEAPDIYAQRISVPDAPPTLTPTPTPEQTDTPTLTPTKTHSPTITPTPVILPGAMWRDQGEEVCLAGDSQENPQACADGQGGAITVWQDNRSGSYDLYAQRTNTWGERIWQVEGIVISSSSGDQKNPKIIPDGQNGAIVFWEDDRNGNWDIYGQRIDQNGNPLWTMNGEVVCSANGNQTSLKVVNGNAALLAWQDARNDGGDIYVQKIDDNGNGLWGANGLAVCSAANTQTEPALIAEGSGGAYVAWTDSRDGVSHIYTQKIDSGGLEQWLNNGICVCDADYGQGGVAIASDGLGGLILVWGDHRRRIYAGSWVYYDDIYAQHLNGSGMITWNANGNCIRAAADLTWTESNKSLQIITDNNQGAFLTWNQQWNTIPYAKTLRFDPTGTKLWESARWGGGYTNYGPAAPQMIADGSGGAYIAWNDWRNNNYPYQYGCDVFLQRIKADGDLRWESTGLPVVNVMGNQSMGSLASDGQGGALLVWQDSRNDANDIFIQRVHKPVPVITAINPTQSLPLPLIGFEVTGNYYNDDKGVVDQVRLTRPGFGDVWATNVNAVDNAALTCDFDLSGVSLGEWRVNVVDSLGQTSKTDGIKLIVTDFIPTVTMTPTETATPSITETFTITPTGTPTPTITITATGTPTAGPFAINEMVIMAGLDGSEIDTLYLLKSRQDGTFDTPVVYDETGGGTIYSTALGDFDNDGYRDDIAVMTADGNAYLYITQQIEPAIQFTKKLLFTYTPPGRCRSIDINNDGYDDLVFMESTTPNPHYLKVGINDHNNNVNISQVFSWSTLGSYEYAGDMVVGDFNGDGNADIIRCQVYSNYCDFTTPLYIHPGQGNGTFAAPQYLFTAPNISRMISGDFNNDLNLDVIYGHDDDDDPGAAYIRLGTGTGTFQAPVLAYDLNPQDNSGCDLPGAGDASVADFDHDGKQDVIISSQGTGGLYKLYFIRGNGNGTFDLPDQRLNPFPYYYLTSLGTAPTIVLTPTHTPTSTATLTPTITPTSSATPSITPTSTPTPYLPVAGDIAWEDDFIGAPGAPLGLWPNRYNVLQGYAATNSYGAVTKTSADSWGKVETGAITCDVTTYHVAEISVAEVSINADWKLSIRQNEGAWLYVNLNPSGASQPGIYTFDFMAITGWSWTGTHSFSLEIVVEGSGGKNVVVDYVKVRKPFPGYTPEPTPVHSSLMDQATPVVLGHFMMSFGNPNVYTAQDDNQWHGWNENGHNPDNLVAPNKRDVASVYYPYFPNPDPDVTPDYNLGGPWDTTDPALVEAHRNELIYADMDGGTFDLQSYYQITGGVLQPGVESWHVGAMRGYLQQFKDETRRHFSALMVYEDKTQWKWVNWSNRADTAAAAKNDLTHWLELFLEAGYDGVQYKINGRPVVYIFSYEENFGTRGYGRLSAQELKDWKDAWTTAHGGVSPILVTSIRQTEHSAELEGGSVKYKDVFEGFFDWPVITGPANPPYDVYNDFSLETSIWSGQDLNARYKVLSGEYSFVGSGAWPGFDDGGVMGWGAGIRRGIPRKEGNEYLFPYHLNRVRANGYPVVQIASWNDWFEGTNIEPSVEFSFDYLGVTGGSVRGMKGASIASALLKGAARFSPLANVVMAASMSFSTPREALFRYLDLTRDGVAAIKNKAPNSGDWWVPYWIYMIRHNLANDPDAQAAADAANAAIGNGDFTQAETILQPWVVVLNYTPTPSPTSTITPTATVTATLTTTPTITETSTMTTTPTITPTPRTPQQIKAWPEQGHVMNPGHSQNLLAISKYHQEPQPNIRVHYQVLLGSGTFAGEPETYVLTGANAEPAGAVFSASDERLDLNIIKVDNLGLGGRKYIVIIVLPGKIKGASAEDGTGLEGQEMVYDNEEEALANGQAAMAAMVELIPSHTPTITLTPTFTQSPTLTPTLTPTATPTQAPWLESGKVMAYPNPARGKVRFAYTLSGAGKVEIDIYRLTGERVVHIEERKDGGAGQTLTTTWEAAGVAPGIYICRIRITDSAGKVVLEQRKKVALIN